MNSSLNGVQQIFAQLYLYLLLGLSSSGVQTARPHQFLLPQHFIISVTGQIKQMTPDQKLSNLIGAMAQHEGWIERGHNGYPEGSISYRNHNPLNLRHSPLAIREVGGFAVFGNDDIGLQAARLDILNKAIGKTSTGLTGESTIADFIKVWAPASDGNDPLGYLRSVAAKSGLPTTTKLKEFIN